MKNVLLIGIIALLLLAGCGGETTTEITSETFDVPITELSDEEILKQYPDDLDSAIADLEALEE